MIWQIEISENRSDLLNFMLDTIKIQVMIYWSNYSKNTDT